MTSLAKPAHVTTTVATERVMRIESVLQRAFSRTPKILLVDLGSTRHRCHCSTNTLMPGTGPDALSVTLSAVCALQTVCWMQTDHSSTLDCTAKYRVHPCRRCTFLS